MTEQGRFPVSKPTRHFLAMLGWGFVFLSYGSEWEHYFDRHRYGWGIFYVVVAISALCFAIENFHKWDEFPHNQGDNT